MLVGNTTGLAIPYHTLPHLTTPYYTLLYLTIPYYTLLHLTTPYYTLLYLYQVGNKTDLASERQVVVSSSK